MGLHTGLAITVKPLLRPTLKQGYFSAVLKKRKQLSARSLENLQHRCPRKRCPKCSHQHGNAKTGRCNRDLPDGTKCSHEFPHVKQSLVVRHDTRWPEPWQNLHAASLAFRCLKNKVGRRLGPCACLSICLPPAAACLSRTGKKEPSAVPSGPARAPVCLSICLSFCSPACLHGPCGERCTAWPTCR
jgi:hypothetical protein